MPHLYHSTGNTIIQNLDSRSVQKLLSIFLPQPVVATLSLIYITSNRIKRFANDDAFNQREIEPYFATGINKILLAFLKGNGIRVWAGQGPERLGSLEVTRYPEKIRNKVQLKPLDALKFTDSWKSTRHNWKVPSTRIATVPSALSRI